MKILVIDDERSVRRMVAKMLAADGHEVIAAADGVEGLAVFRRERPAVVVTDIIMPNQEGMETIMALRHEDPRVRIIAMSGSGTPDGELNYLRMAKLLGADASLEKPFRAEELRAVVRQLSQLDA